MCQAGRWCGLSAGNPLVRPRVIAAKSPGSDIRPPPEIDSTGSASTFTDRDPFAPVAGAASGLSCRATPLPAFSRRALHVPMLPCYNAHMYPRPFGGLVASV